MKSYYKIINNMPLIVLENIDNDASFIEYEIGKEPKEILDSISKALKKQELNTKIVEAKQYLKDTDYKMTLDYDKDVTEVKAKRAEAREFIRANK